MPLPSVSFLHMVIRLSSIGRSAPRLTRRVRSSGAALTFAFFAVACSGGAPDTSASADSTVQSAAADSSPRFVAITAGRQFTCAVDEAAQAWCWGSNRFGQLGLGDTLDRFRPTQLQHSVPLRRVVAGETHSCAVDSLAALHCWGDNKEFALGDTAVRVRARPGTVELRGVRQVALGANFTCATDSADRTRCWGTHQHGQRGDGSTERAPVATPTPIKGDHRFIALAAGRSHACGITAEGSAWCWGDGGALGDGTVNMRMEPVGVLGEQVFTSITAGESVTCAIHDDASAWCWGIAFDGQLGQGSPSPNRFIPVPVAGGIRFQALSAGHHRVCGLDLEGTAWCWGSNYNGGLGDNGGVSQPAPVRVVSEVPFIAIASGDYHTCALDTTRVAWCWGENSDARGGGALGDGTVRQRPIPTRVSSARR